MTRLNELLLSAANPVLISVHPKFATAIATGTKRVEFRRRWPDVRTDVAVIYATLPRQSIVAVIEIEGVVRQSPSQLWQLARTAGGGVTREMLRDYFHGLTSGVALRLGRRVVFHEHLSPEDVFGQPFRPPQSFRYLKPVEIAAMSRLLGDRSWE